MTGVEVDISHRMISLRMLNYMTLMSIFKLTNLKSNCLGNDESWPKNVFDIFLYLSSTGTSADAVLHRFHFKGKTFYCYAFAITIVP